MPSIPRGPLRDAPEEDSSLLLEKAKRDYLERRKESVVNREKSNVIGNGAKIALGDAGGNQSAPAAGRILGLACSLIQGNEIQ